MSAAPDSPSGWAVIEAAVQASLRSGLSVLRAAATNRLLQALLLLLAGLVVEAGPIATTRSAAIVGFAFVGIIVLEGLGPGMVFRAARPDRPHRRIASMAAAGLRGALMLALAVGPALLAVLIASGVSDGEAQVVVGLVAAPVVLTGLGAAFVLAARTGPAALLAAGGEPVVDALRGAWRRRAPALIPQAVLLTLEVFAAVVATTVMGQWPANAVLAAPWGEIIAAELEVAALWRMLGAPVLVLSVFIHAAGLAATEALRTEAAP